MTTETNTPATEATTEATTEASTPTITKLTLNKSATEVTAKSGRKNVWKMAAPDLLTANTLQGILDGADLESATLQDDLSAAFAKALDRRGSVIPENYREKYGADQNCGDDLATKLTAKVTDPKEGVNLDAVADIASQNGEAERFDRWMTKGLNPGMIRMNLGNVLRAKAKRGEEIKGL